MPQNNPFAYLAGGTTPYPVSPIAQLLQAVFLGRERAKHRKEEEERKEFERVDRELRRRALEQDLTLGQRRADLASQEFDFRRSQAQRQNAQQEIEQAQNLAKSLGIDISIPGVPFQTAFPNVQFPLGPGTGVTSADIPAGSPGIGVTSDTPARVTVPGSQREPIIQTPLGPMPASQAVKVFGTEGVRRITEVEPRVSPAEQRQAAQAQAKTAQEQFATTRDQLVRKIHERVDAGDAVGARSAVNALNQLANQAPGIGTTGDTELQKALRVREERERKERREEGSIRRTEQLLARGVGAAAGVEERAIRREARAEQRALEREARVEERQSRMAVENELRDATAKTHAAYVKFRNDPTPENRAAWEAAAAERAVREKRLRDAGRQPTQVRPRTEEQRTPPPGWSVAGRDKRTGHPVWTDGKGNYRDAVTGKLLR